MSYAFGTRSRNELITCHKDLQLIGNTSIKRSPIDWGIHQGARTVPQQQDYFDSGTSRINPSAYPDIRALAKVAKHIVIPGDPDYELSRAFDFHISTKHKAMKLTWDDLHLGIIIGVIMSTAQELYDQGLTKHLVRSGGDWDRDGVFVYDHKLKDLPHIELYKP